MLDLRRRRTHTGRPAAATLRDHLPSRRDEWSVAKVVAERRALLARFIEAHERSDAVALARLLREDVRITIPPLPVCFAGREAARPLFDRFTSGEHGTWRLVPTSADRKPAAASCHRAPGEPTFQAHKPDVLRVVDGSIAEIVTLPADVFGRFGLPEVLPGSRIPS